MKLSLRIIINNYSGGQLLAFKSQHKRKNVPSLKSSVFKEGRIKPVVRFSVVYFNAFRFVLCCGIVDQVTGRPYLSINTCTTYSQMFFFRTVGERQPKEPSNHGKPLKHI